jgi:cytochrome c
MNKLKALTILVVGSSIFFSCGKKEEKKAETPPPKEEVKQVEKQVESKFLTGKELFRKYNCQSCHSVEGVKVAPPLKEIARVYKGKKDELVAFLQGKRPNKLNMGDTAHLMHLQVKTTMKLPKEQLEKIADYILQFAD